VCGKKDSHPGIPVLREFRGKYATIIIIYPDRHVRTILDRV
jgi:hypothetical protein